jgi:two-component system, chemotaxis family, chemotaxis protein CheY
MRESGRCVNTKKTALIVDDSEFVRKYHAYIMEQGGFQAIEAADGREGLEKLLANHCDMILADINMSNMDGYEFIRRVRGQKQYISLPIIIVSTESEAKDKAKGFDAGANLYVVKPVTPQTMLENVRLLLSMN